MNDDLTEHYFLQGKGLTPELVADLENRLLTDPSDLPIRCALLGYYHYSRSESQSANWARHYCWLAVNAADSVIIQRFLGIPDMVRTQDREKVRVLWLAELNSRPDDPRILQGASKVIRYFDNKLTEQLLLKGAQLEPDNTEWAFQLGRFYCRQITDGPEASRESSAAKLFDLESSLMKHPHRGERFTLLGSMLHAVLLRDETDRAMRYAKARLRIASWLGVWEASAHLNVAQVYLRQGNRRQAVKHLMSSARHGWGAYGSNVGALEDFAAAGEFGVLIHFLKVCRKHDPGWREDFRPRRYPEWITQLKQSELPDFSIVRQNRR